MDRLSGSLESAGNLVANIVCDFAIGFAIRYIKRELGYLCCIDSHFQNLESEVRKLKKTRDYVQDMVSIAKDHSQVIKPVVEDWLSKVGDIVENSQVIIDNHSRRNDGILCSNFVRGYKLNKQASKTVDEAIQMKMQGDAFSEVSIHVVLNESAPSKEILYSQFKSREATMNEIMDALEDNHVNKIGVCGMGGVGKTMLVKEIVKIVLDKKSFDEVLTSTVTRTPDPERIRRQLADKLDLKLEEEEEIEGRALQMHNRLRKKKSILVVLDDVCENINLETIGIPNRHEEFEGYKILFISRDKNLLSNEMRIKKTFEINVLTEEESWQLFMTVVGAIVDDFKFLTYKIAKKCACFPIAITVVAKALRNHKNSFIWKDALNQLKRREDVNIEGMDKKVYSSLKLSYDYLEWNEAKLLLLSFSTFPEGVSISMEELEQCAMQNDFLHDVDTDVQRLRRITKLVDWLISSSLLQRDEYKDNYVKMHDLVREVAISITPQNHRLSDVKTGSRNWNEPTTSKSF